MSNISSIAGGAGWNLTGQPLQTDKMLQTGTSSAEGALSTTTNQQILSSTSVGVSGQSAIASNGPVLADDAALGAALLLLTLEYLQTDDDEEKSGLLALMLLMAQQQQTNDLAGAFLTSTFSSLAIESTQMQGMTTGSLAAYQQVGAGAVPPADAGAGGSIDAMA